MNRKSSSACNNVHGQGTKNDIHCDKFPKVPPSSEYHCRQKFAVVGVTGADGVGTACVGVGVADGRGTGVGAADGRGTGVGAADGRGTGVGAADGRNTVCVNIAGTMNVPSVVNTGSGVSVSARQ